MTSSTVFTSSTNDNPPLLRNTLDVSFFDKSPLSADGALKLHNDGFLYVYSHGTYKINVQLSVANYDQFFGHEFTTSVYIDRAATQNSIYDPELYCNLQLGLDKKSRDDYIPSNVFKCSITPSLNAGDRIRVTCKPDPRAGLLFLAPGGIVDYGTFLNGVYASISALKLTI